MKEFRFRIIAILAFLGLSLYLLHFTYLDNQNSKTIQKALTHFADSIKNVNPEISDAELNSVLTIKEDSIEVSNPSFKNAREKRVKLGLDLQGGMYLVMEVNTSKLLAKLAKDPEDENFQEVLRLAEEEAKLSDLDIVSIIATKIKERGELMSLYFGSLRDTDDEIIARLQEQEEDAVTRAIEIIRNRVNQYGVSEPNIQPQGARRIIVELPGVSKEEEAKRLLQATAMLEFRLVKDADFTIPILNRIDEVLAQSLGMDSVDVADSTNLSEDEFAKMHPFFAVARINPQSPYADAFVLESERSTLEAYLNRPEVKNVIPDNVEFMFSAKEEGKTEEGENFYFLYLVNKTPELTGEVVTDANANKDPQTNAPIVYMSMNSEGAREWARITGSNIQKRCAIVLDKFIYSAPVIQGKIPTGTSTISGIPDLEEAKLLEIVLKAGALKAPVDIIEERTVGPSLGQDSINQGFNSTMIGFFLVALFMIFYYKKAGVVSDLALFFTLIFIMGILAGFKATLTLPGIAGIILTVGMAVDANVLIYERIREELRTGKTVKAAVDSGYKNSFSAIIDSNITSFFTAIILYQFGSGPIQGFALTLMIGIVCSLFSAFIVTRVIFDMMVAKGMKVNIV